MDPFDPASFKDLQSWKKYYQIIFDSPEIYVKQSEIECSREEYRILTNNQIAHYYKAAAQIHPMSEVLTNINKFAAFCNPISNLNEDIGVKFTVSLQLAYKTIENLGTERHIPWM